MACLAFRWWVIGCCCWFLLGGVAFAQRDLRTIPDPDPELERQTFIVPEGFEVQLWAADPAMAKPIQMNFDEQGRLWVASSEVYPHIKPGETPHDKVLVLQDTDGDGRADRTTVFADGLLIPTGVIAGDGGAYVVNSTELLHLRDTNGDGRADRREVVLSGFGTEDTHHLLHTLRWGHDGCLYMNQSIYIHSHVETPHGVRRLNGGGIWRFRPETRELEVLCYGFVNSWGHHFDAWGQSFATDGAYHEGINYVFPGSVFVTAPGAKRLVAGLNPGSPKHCGLEIVSGRHLPDDWSGSMITNDFRAHRVCRFVVTEDGSGYASRQEVEVIKSTHIAFRPIDAKMGPDGALYIADWYNPIIQHGEVDFRDPRRDHVHGRIWRVSAKGRATTRLPAFGTATTEQLLACLAEPEEWVRLHAKLTLKQRAAASDEARRQLLAEVARWSAGLQATTAPDEHLLLESLWLHQALRVVEPSLLKRLLGSADHRARAAALRVATEWRRDVPDSWALFSQGVTDQHPRVRLEAVRGLARFPSIEAAGAALRVLRKPMDRFLDFALWQTMRDLEPVWLPLAARGETDWAGGVEPLLYALRALEPTPAVQPLLQLIRENRVPGEQLDGVLEIIAAGGGPSELRAVLDLVLAGGGRLADAERASLLEGLVRTSRVRQIKPAGELSDLGKLMSTDHGALRGAAARAAGTWKLASLTPQLTRWATAPDNSPEVPLVVREGAIAGLAALGDPAAIQTLDELTRPGRTVETRRLAISALASVAVPRAAAGVVRLLQEISSDEVPLETVRALLGQRQGPAALAQALRDQSLGPDTAKVLIRAVQSGPRPEPTLLEAIRQAGKLADTGWKWSPELAQELVAATAASGDPSRGEAIFRRADLQCLKCHAIAGAGGRVGSDLISLGATAPVDYIVESLLNPNAKVKEGYHSKLIVTAEGRVVTGIPVRESAGELVLRDAEDREQVIPVSAIEERKDGRSLMPDGSVDLLTRAELVDLIRFLSELGKVGPYSVGNARVVRRWETLTWTAAAHQRLNRTSHDTAATNDPALLWQGVYSQVDGNLPVTGLPQFKPHNDTQPTSFVRCQVEVTTAGAVTLQVNSPAGLAAWLDGKPIAVAETMTLELSRGLHTLTWDINHARRNSPLRVELRDVPGSPAQAQVVGGK